MEELQVVGQDVLLQLLSPDRHRVVFTREASVFVAFAASFPRRSPCLFTREASAALCPFHEGSDVAFGRQVIDPAHGILALRPTNLACCLDHDGKEASSFDCSGSTHQLLSQLAVFVFKVAE